MIRTLANKTTAAVFCGQTVKSLPAGIQAIALRKLEILDAVASLTDLLAPPANRLELMGGRRRGQWRGQIQPPWHLCFRFVNGEAWDVEIAQCHDSEQA